MLVVALFHLAAALYLGAGLVAVVALVLPAPRLGRAVALLLGAGCAAHAAAFGWLHTLRPIPALTDLPAALSLMAWMAALAALGLLRGARWVGLSALVAPLAALTVFFTSLARFGAGASEANSGSWPHLHVLLASAGLALLGLAALAGTVFLLEERPLKRRRPMAWGTRLPSLEALDRVNRVALATGFALLTVAFVAGVLWNLSLKGRPFVGTPHELWTALAWVVYGGLATARFAAGWRGREAALSSALGFAFLLVAVIGVELAT